MKSETVQAIVLDANMLIAFLDAHQVDHEWAVGVLAAHATASFIASSVNVAEALVYPAKNGALTQAREAFAAIELVVSEIGPAEAEKLAVLRAETSLRMPDVCALLAALSANATLVTRDRRLATAARVAGVDVIDG